MSRKRTKTRSYGKGRHRRKDQKLLLPLAIISLGVIMIAAFFAFRPRGARIDPNFVPEVNGAPSLKTDKEMIDFGDVKVGEWVSASFRLTNVGDEKLQFLQKPFIEVREGC